MKTIKICLSISLLFAAISASAQSLSKLDSPDKTHYKNVEIAFSKTTSIIFPYAIKSVDKGSDEILVQKAKGVENVLLLKAGVKNFTQTNLTVVTADGKLYGFMTNYDEQCPVLNFTAQPSDGYRSEVLFSSENENQKIIEQYAQLALSKNQNRGGLKTSNYSIKVQITGIFIHQDFLYLRLVLGNRSRIGYDVDQLRFFIRDQKKSARTASQEIEISPVYSTANIVRIADASQVNVVFALPKITIPEKKKFIVQMIEKDGGRNVELEFKSSDLEKVALLNGM